MSTTDPQDAHAHTSRGTHPRIYVISLASAGARRSRMLARLRRQALDHQVVDALDRDDLAVQVYRDPDRDTPQDRGAAACLASHLRALRCFVAAGADEAIVAEDDVELARDFATRFAQLRANVPADCPLVCLGYLVWDWTGFLPAGRDPARDDLRTLGPDTWGTQMYWIRRSWAQECLHRLDRPFAAIETLQQHRNSETITRDAAPRGGLVAHPPLAIEDLTGSLIVPEAGTANHPEALARWDRAGFDGDARAGEEVLLRPAFSPASCYVLRDLDEVAYFTRHGGAPEAALIDWATQLVRPHESFVDVGAHVGSWTQHFAQKCREVHAFEPQRSTYDRLCAGIRQAGLPNVTCHAVALGATGEVDLHVISADGGGSTLRPRSELGPALAVERVSGAQLDDFALDDVGLIKIDAEGAEAAVLRGAARTLATHGYPTLLLEAWLHDWYAAERAALIAQVEALGYHVQPVLNCPEMLLAEHPARRADRGDGTRETPRGEHPQLVTRSVGERPLLGLVMIVKNEASRIVEVLRSYLPHIDRWCVLDTGSTDGTQDLVRRELAGVPGTLHEEPFVDFATSRNRALELHGRTTVFTIMPNGDVLQGGAALRSFLETHRDDPAGAYRVRISPGHYYHPLVMRTGAGWHYKWRTHECAVGPHQGPQIPGVTVVRDRDRRTDAEWRERWTRDLELLQRDREADPRDPRPWFYLGQTHECLGQPAEALACFEQRATMGGYFDEVYEAKFRVGKMRQALERPWAEVQQAYLEAHAHDPRRAEPLHAIAEHWHAAEQHAITRLFAAAAAELPKPATDLFLDEEIYTWRAADLAAIASFYSGHKDTGRRFADQAVRQRPDDERLRANQAFYAQSAGDLFGATARAIDFVPEPGWSASNPSICRGPGGLRCVVRTVNYQIMPDGAYATPAGDGVIRTRNFLLDLDDALATTRVVEMVDRDPTPRTDFPIHGFEDARLFFWKGGWWATATVCDFTQGRREIALLQVAENGAIVRAEPLRGPWSDQTQKNWMPIVDEARGTAKLVYATHPTTIFDLVGADDPDVRRLSWHVADRAAVGCELDATFEHGRLRGGSQAVRVDGGWLFVVHDVAFPGSGRLYLHRFARLNDRLELVGLSDPFYFEQLGIEFCAGLAIVGEHLVASYAVRDRTARLGIFAREAVERSLRTDFVI